MHRESLGYKNHFNLKNLHEGEVVEVATDSHVLHFLCSGGRIKVTDSLGRKLSKEAIDVLGAEDDTEISMNEELILPSQHIIEGERVILIRLLEEEKGPTPHGEADPKSGDRTSH